MNNNEIGDCPICQRPMLKGVFVDEHHLIPKSKNGKYTDKITVHRICHSKIHSIWTEAELANYYHTVDRILENTDMQRFVKWVKKKPVDFYAKTKFSNRRRR